MINKGIIRNISDKDIFVEAFTSESGEGHSCGSGSCDHCSQKGKTRLVRAENPENLSLRIGNTVEMEIPSSAALLAFFRILLLPPLLFALLYIPAAHLLKWTATNSIIAGAAGFSLAIVLILLLKNKTSVKETPRILRVL
ncbi:SoxR reducing system RseC family protein [Spirochaeta isovalerica]|uniref:Positive regulator of sigma E activity n=1 Tax=Spirochaeta isovalerica TaxID=150 RepID=A0A841RF33_9SPIO|nr:SoxR reducing system RseC family protein [Spirochaeta isovalerica]MBB6481208.1 positive regulator of sigma E activity [Spirochaeta isovalerica]